MSKNSSEPSEKNLIKSIKQPDLFQEKVIKCINYLGQNRGKVFFTSGLLALVGISYFGFLQFRKSADNKLKHEVAKVDALFRQEAKDYSKQVKIFQDKIDLVKKAKEELAKTPSQTDQIKADLANKESEIKSLQDSANLLEPDHAKSSEQFYAFYKGNSDTVYGFMAGIKYASHLAKLKKLAEVKDLLTEIKLKSTKSPFYQIQTRLMLLAVHEDLKEYGDAIKVADELLTMAPEALKPRVLLAKGRVFVEQKESQKAIEVFDALIKEHSDSREVDTARSYKALVN